MRYFKFCKKPSVNYPHVSIFVDAIKQVWHFKWDVFDTVDCIDWTTCTVCFECIDAIFCRLHKINSNFLCSHSFSYEFHVIWDWPVPELWARLAWKNICLWGIFMSIPELWTGVDLFPKVIQTSTCATFWILPQFWAINQEASLHS